MDDMPQSAPAKMVRSKTAANQETIGFKRGETPKSLYSSAKKKRKIWGPPRYCDDGEGEILRED